jgi:glycerol-3-phosphate acyltransferase PlsY
MSQEALAILALAYFIGATPSAYLVARAVAGVDIRTVGDANVGARNVAAQIGLSAGVFVALMDVAKGALVITIAERLQSDVRLTMLAGLIAVLGHDWTIFLGFHGGKGMATTVGVYLALFPMQTVIALIASAFLYLFTRHFDRTAALGFLVAVTEIHWAYGWGWATYAAVLAVFIGLKKLIDLPRERMMQRRGAALAANAEQRNHDLPEPY